MQRTSCVCVKQVEYCLHAQQVWFLSIIVNLYNAPSYMAEKRKCMYIYIYIYMYMYMYNYMCVLVVQVVEIRTLMAFRPSLPGNVCDDHNFM